MCLVYNTRISLAVGAMRPEGRWCKRELPNSNIRLCDSWLRQHFAEFVTRANQSALKVALSPKHNHWSASQYMLHIGYHYRCSPFHFCDCRAHLFHSSCFTWLWPIHSRFHILPYILFVIRCDAMPLCSLCRSPFVGVLRVLSLDPLARYASSAVLYLSDILWIPLQESWVCAFMRLPFKPQWNSWMWKIHLNFSTKVEEFSRSNHFG